MTEKMVTRTISTTTATVLGLDLSTDEAVQRKVTLSGEFKTSKDLLKAIRKKCELDVFEPVKIIDSKVTEKLYGMSETEFLKHAKVLPPRPTTEK